MNIIEVKNLSKKYNITHTEGGYIALRDVLTNIAKHPFEFLKSKIKRNSKEEFWALKNISFNVQKGEAIGIIGANGAGKSTLLKILSKITPPTTGEIRFQGRVSSLLEVGTGFHPELTGRENIFLNGAILGMTKKEIAEKFNDIVSFAGVEKFLDTPVKRYSSGMYVRLAFAVAAHMEPDILIVDEVLAVGDADFQKKCLGKMNEVTKTAGRTILFVSHNMEAVQKLCQRAILLENGEIKKIGDTKDILNTYLSSNPLAQQDTTIKTRRDRKGQGEVKITSFFVEDENGKKVEDIISGGNYSFCVGYESSDKKPVSDLSMAIAFSNENGSPIALNWTKYTNQDFKHAPAKGIVCCKINEKFPLSEGMYNIAINLFGNGIQQDFIKNFGVFEVKWGDFYGTGSNLKHSPVLLEQKWSIKESI